MFLRRCTSFILIVCLSAASALYFHIGETEKKCFIEEIPDETMVVGRYKVLIFDKNSNDYVPTVHGLGMHVEIKDPEDKMILSRTYAAEGRFTFTSHSAGEHVICLHSNSTAWFSSGQLRVHLDIQVGEHAIDYQQVQAKDKLSELQLRIRQLVDQVEQVTKEQNYQRYREERFRATSESTNQRVLWWSIAQTVILLITGFWQMRHLKSFFEAKKLDITPNKHHRPRAFVGVLCDSRSLFMQFAFGFNMHTREERFRLTSESTNQRVFWWSVGQTLLLIVIGLLQMIHLKRFFLAKKLV